MAEQAMDFKVEDIVRRLEAPRWAGSIPAGTLGRITSVKGPDIRVKWDGCLSEATYFHPQTTCWFQKVLAPTFTSLDHLMRELLIEGRGNNA